MSPGALNGALLLAAVSVGGCAAAQNQLPKTPPPDRPVPADAPRAQLRLRLDLPAAADCEEAFDLALYQDRGIHLVKWDPATDDCDGRVVTITYLSRRLTASQVLARVRQLATRALELPATAGAPETAPPLETAPPAGPPAPSSSPISQPPSQR